MADSAGVAVTAGVAASASGVDSAGVSDSAGEADLAGVADSAKEADSVGQVAFGWCIADTVRTLLVPPPPAKPNQRPARPSRRFVRK